MTATEFEDTLRRYLRAEPFVPFVVDLLDGRQILVKRPPVVFADGAASFIDLDDEALVDFACEDVKVFRPADQGVGA